MTSRRDFLRRSLLASSGLLLGCNADDLVSSTRIYADGSLDAATATVKVLKDQAFPQKVNFYPATGYDISGCYFHQGYGVTTGRWLNFRENVVRIPGGFPVISAGDMADTVLLGATSTNPHFLTPGTMADLVFDGLVFEYLGTAANGDCFNLPQITAGPLRHYSLLRSIVLANAAGNNSGTLVSQLGSARVAVSVLQCTALMGGGGGLGGGETYGGYPGMYRRIAGNLFHDAVRRGFALNDQSSGGIVVDLVQQAGLEANIVWNARVGPKGPGIQWPLSYTPGTLIEADPQFADPSVSLRRWDLAEGGVGTNGSACNRLLARAGTPAELLAFIRAGMTPTNPAVAGFGAV